MPQEPGSALEATGRTHDARDQFERALSLDPEHAEAHFALGLWHLRTGDLERALYHLDNVSQRRGSALRLAPVMGWKAKVLFDLDRYEEAFAMVDAIVAFDGSEGWEWPWCARLIQEHGTRTSTQSVKALRFWRAFLRVYPNDKSALAQEFTCASKAQMAGRPTGVTLEGFARKGKVLLTLDGVDSGFVWDRIGHWAQTEGDWRSAEASYRQAYALDPSRYAYCLGTALNHLHRWDEALVVLTPETALTEDAMYWFQVAVARDKLGDAASAIRDYRRALELDPTYAAAHFNLGGVLWNNGLTQEAVEVWREAITRFPQHSLVGTLLENVEALRGA